MKRFRPAWFFVGLLASPAVSAAQKTIVISDSLAGNAERLNVKKGAQWLGRIATWRFGDYAVVSSQKGWTTASTKRNLFNTEAESSSTDKFSFVLTNNTTDSATVTAARNITVQSLRALRLALGHGWFFGRDEEVVQESDNFTAFITLNRDTIETWALFMGGTSGPSAEGHYEAFLTNGERRIVLSTASSNKNVYDIRGLPALGYEFIEIGQSLCAVQYYGGTFGITQVVWIRRSLDASMKLILAAAMTAVLQVNSL